MVYSRLSRGGHVTWIPALKLSDHLVFVGLQRSLDLPRLRGHPAKHESAIGVDDGETRRGQAADVFG
jgi:hypothetical protein